MSGWLHVVKIFSKITSRGNAIESSQSWIIWPDIPSGPAALLGLMLRISETISLFRIEIRLNLLFVTKLKLGRMLSFTLRVHWFEKKSLKSLAFSRQSDTILLSTRRGEL